MTKSIGIVASFDGSSGDEWKIVMLHTDGSEVTVTQLASFTRAGINYIRSHGLKRMYEQSGLSEIVESMVIGDKEKSDE